MSNGVGTFFAAAAGNPPLNYLWHKDGAPIPAATGIGVGPGEADPTSLEEIGRRLGLTRERVRQIEIRALERLSLHREVSAFKPAA